MPSRRRMSGLVSINAHVRERSCGRRVEVECVLKGGSAERKRAIGFESGRGDAASGPGRFCTRRSRNTTRPREVPTSTWADDEQWHLRPGLPFSVPFHYGISPEFITRRYVFSFSPASIVPLWNGSSGDCSSDWNSYPFKNVK